MSPDITHDGSGRDQILSGSAGAAHLRLALAKADAPLIPNLSMHSFVAEQYRRLVVQILEDIDLDSRESGYVLGITSPDPGVGKTLTSLNLSMTLAQSAGDRRHLLIEGDLWRPRFLEYLDVHRSVGGLGAALKSGSLQPGQIARMRGTNLDLVVAGRNEPVTDVMPGSRLGGLIQQVKSQYDVIILDCPPMALASGHALASFADSVILVVGARKTQKKYIEDCLTSLGPNQVLGLLLNKERDANETYYSYRAYSKIYQDAVDGETLEPSAEAATTTAEPTTIAFDGSPSPMVKTGMLSPSAKRTVILVAAIVGLVALLFFLVILPAFDGTGMSSSEPLGRSDGSLAADLNSFFSPEGLSIVEPSLSETACSVSPG